MSGLVNVVNKCYNYNPFWQLCNLIEIHSEHLCKTMMCIEDAAAPISSAKLTGIIGIIVSATVGTSDLFKAKYRDILCVCVCVSPLFVLWLAKKRQCGIYWPFHKWVSYFEVKKPFDLSSVISYIPFVNISKLVPLLTWSWFLPAWAGGYWRPIGHQILYWFARAAIRKCHGLSGLNHRNWLSHCSGG